METLNLLINRQAIIQRMQDLKSGTATSRQATADEPYTKHVLSINDTGFLQKELKGIEDDLLAMRKYAKSNQLVSLLSEDFIAMP